MSESMFLFRFNTTIAPKFATNTVHVCLYYTTKLMFISTFYIIMCLNCSVLYFNLLLQIFYEKFYEVFLL